MFCDQNHLVDRWRSRLQSCSVSGILWRFRSFVALQDFCVVSGCLLRIQILFRGIRTSPKKNNKNICQDISGRVRIAEKRFSGCHVMLELHPFEHLRKNTDTPGCWKISGHFRTNKNTQNWTNRTRVSRNVLLMFELLLTFQEFCGVSGCLLRFRIDLFQVYRHVCATIKKNFRIYITMCQEISEQFQFIRLRLSVNIWTCLPGCWRISGHFRILCGCVCLFHHVHDVCGVSAF